MSNTVAFISEHASPLATLGGVDAGGQNVYVAELAKQLTTKDYQVDIYTRREDRNIPEVVNWLPGIRVIHIAAGPVKYLPKEVLPEYMHEFRDNMLAFIQKHSMRYDLIHANFFMSSKVASELKSILGIPFVVTFHALGHIRKKYQKEADKFSEDRMEVEQRVMREAD